MHPIRTALFAAAACFAATASGLTLRVYTPASHDRFLNFPAAASPNPSFIHAGLDLSGVGYHTGDTRKQFTLVAPKYFVGANHFRPPLGSTLRFVTASGAFVERTVEALHTIENDVIQPDGKGQATDLLLGELSAPIEPESGVQFLPYLNLVSEGAYIGQPLVVLGKPARGGRGTIGAIADFGGDPLTGGSGISQTRTMHFSYNTLAGLADDAHAEGGDSGSPSLVVEDGRAALVGTHTAVLNLANTVTTIDTFVPHYIDELNQVMEAGGYHMTAATPASTTLGLSAQLPSGPIRAGYPFAVVIGVVNEGTGADANNLRVEQSLPVGCSVVDASGPMWVAQPGSGTLRARRGGLGAGQSSALQVELNYSEPGSFSSALTLDYDEGEMVTSSVDVMVIESYLSWSRDLGEAGSPGDDPDADGAENLLEYAVGSEPDEASGERLPVTQLVVVGGEIRARLTYVRRTDAQQRALVYTLEASDSLAVDSWSDAASEVMSSSTAPLVMGFESVEVEFAVAAPRRFYRLRVDLEE